MSKQLTKKEEVFKNAITLIISDTIHTERLCQDMMKFM